MLQLAQIRKGMARIIKRANGETAASSRWINHNQALQTLSAKAISGVPPGV
jgi:hypothetical protein